MRRPPFSLTDAIHSRSFALSTQLTFARGRQIKRFNGQTDERASSHSNHPGLRRSRRAMRIFNSGDSSSRPIAAIGND